MIRSLLPMLAAMLLLSPALGARYSSAHWAQAMHGGGRGGDDAGARQLSGTVVDAAGQAASGAVVYLENKHNLAIYTYIAGSDGSYRFNNLSPDVDYEVHAEANGHKSPVRTLSSFDSHKQARINLKLGK